jgi:hypothetical protein
MSGIGRTGLLRPQPDLSPTGPFRYRVRACGVRGTALGELIAVAYRDTCQPSLGGSAHKEQVSIMCGVVDVLDEGPTDPR